MKWLPFTKVEFINTISKYNYSSTQGPNYIFWSHLKIMIKNNKCITNFVNIANSCIDLSHLLSHFKKSMLIIILKINKFSYNTLKIFWPIILLNIVEKLIKKAISNRIQAHSIPSNFIHPIQICGVKQWSTTDTGIFLTHIICTRWLRGLHTSTLTFNITQFFQFLNH